MCIDIVEIWFWISNRQISSIFDSYLPATFIFSFLDDDLSKCHWIMPKFCRRINIVKIWYGLLIVKFHQFLIIVGYYGFTFCFFFFFFFFNNGQVKGRRVHFIHLGLKGLRETVLCLPLVF